VVAGGVLRTPTDSTASIQVWQTLSVRKTLSDTRLTPPPNGTPDTMKSILQTKALDGDPKAD